MNKKLESVEITVIKPEEENAAIIIQTFFFKKVSKTKSIPDKLQSKYDKIKKNSSSNKLLQSYVNNFKNSEKITDDLDKKYFQKFGSIGSNLSREEKKEALAILRRRREDFYPNDFTLNESYQHKNYFQKFGFTRRNLSSQVTVALGCDCFKICKNIKCNLFNRNSEENKEKRYSITRLSEKMPVTYFLMQFLSRPITAFIFTVFLLYNVFIYTYLGILKGEGSFYIGFMYSTCYSGVIVAYWMLYRQKHQILNWTYIVSNELILKFVEKKGRPFNQYELMEQNQRHHLVRHDPGYKSFIDYCISWEFFVRWIVFVWQGFGTAGIIMKYSGKWEIIFGNSFDNTPLAFYGYYNLIGQYIASIIILTSAATLFIGFYNLQCLVLCYAGNIREHRVVNFDEEKVEEMEEQTKNIEVKYIELRDRYLYLQKCCTVLGNVWTKPVIISSIFSTQVIISNIFVIQKQIEYCKDGCSFFMVFPIIWCLTAIYLLHMILNGISSINDSASVIKQVFTFSTNAFNEDDKHGDYWTIGGRDRWLTYIDSNPIELKIGGTTVTKKYVINSISTIVVGVGSFALSNLLN